MLPMVPNTSVPFLELGSNGTILEDCNYTESWNWLHSLQPAYMSAICALGVVGNSFVLCVFWLQGKHLTVADVYLSNLAAADLVMSVCLPFWVVTVAQGFQWSFGTLLCKLVNTAISMNYYCSILFLVVVSVDRYLALVKPMSFGRRRSWSQAKRVCFTIWALGFLLSVPDLLFRSVKQFPDLGVDACYLNYPHNSWKVQKNITTNTVGFLIPLPVISFCVYHIIRALQDTEFPRYSKERRASCLVLIVLVAYCICLFPHQVVTFLDTLDYFEVTSGCLWGHVLDIGTQLACYLAYGNSALNPFLYVIVGNHFRRRAKQMFRQVLNHGVKDRAVNLISATKFSHSSKLSLEQIKIQSPLTV
ncbi:B2 bradykinin receptor-like [Arapaima gigas]